MSKILANNLTKLYPPSGGNSNPVIVLQDISFHVEDKQLVTVFGPNGCGKTTLIRVLAGIEAYNSGTVLIDGMPPSLARTGLVFQDYNGSLMPWLTCRENILFPFRFKMRKTFREKAEKRLKELLTSLELSLPLNNYPYEVSGGQQQLVSILRTLIYEPDVILMDEPFSALDFQTRALLQKAILDIWHEAKTTILFVSHDIEEAIFLADRILLLSALPATIKADKVVPFKRPRQSELLESNEFFRFKLECLQNMKNI